KQSQAAGGARCSSPHRYCTDAAVRPRAGAGVSTLGVFELLHGGANDGLWERVVSTINDNTSSDSDGKDAHLEVLVLVASPSRAQPPQSLWRLRDSPGSNSSFRISPSSAPSSAWCRSRSSCSCGLSGSTICPACFRTRRSPAVWGPRL
ncbi:7909_t:CDS:2, partial [Scutellospora calospora]